jgi:hypothetical protein
MALATGPPSPDALGPDLPPATPAPATRPRALPRGLSLVLLGFLLVFIVWQGSTLHGEWSALQREMAAARSTAVIGYPGIQPAYSFAQRPRDWFRRDGDQTLLWAGWQHGVGHSWFRVGTGEVDRARISAPVGRDTHRAIDSPVVEFGGGTLWSRIPGDAVVAGGLLGGVETAYPLLVLHKVVVVNDLVGDRPFLVTFNPLALPHEQVKVYETVLAGRRITMGLTGYLHDRAPMLYDRGTESLWVARDGELRAISGRHKGASLKQVTRVTPVSWDRWRSEHPRSRLVVGADRSAARPDL